jgi:hypothetical protein
MLGNTLALRLCAYTVRLCVFILALGVADGYSETINWPLKPFTSPHPLGNGYGEYQDYGTGAYLHPGIDILGQDGDSVFAIKSGYVKAVLTTSASLHWRVAVGDSASSVACDGYLYAHLEQSTIQVAPGGAVAAGQYIGKLVMWPIAEFHHLHFVKIRQDGFPWTSDWQFIHNPLDYLVDITDGDAPELLTLANGSYFAFYPNGGSSYFAVGDTLSGAVDFLVSARDKIGHPTWQLAPYRISYRLRSDSLSYGPYLSVQFRDTLWWDQYVPTTYRNDAVYDSKGDYGAREYYIICTNNDNDDHIEPGDADSAWFTGDYPNGSYWLAATVLDRFGNRDEESLQVVIENYLTFSGNVLLADVPPSHAGAIVSLPQLGVADTTDASGAFAIAGVGPGDYEIRIERPYYDSIITAENLTTRDGVRNYVLQPEVGLRGDVNHSQTLDAADVIFLVMYVFKSGAAPEPISIGDVNGIPPITSSDILYLVNYIFKSGPPPPPL